MVIKMKLLEESKENDQKPKENNNSSHNSISDIDCDIFFKDGSSARVLNINKILWGS